MNRFFKPAVYSLFLSLSLGAFAQKNDLTPKPLGNLVDIGGYKLHINVTGKGKPAVVLISGAGDFSFDWSLVQPEVSRFALCISYDRAGLAWSDLGPTPRTMRQEVSELRLLLKKSKIKAPYVLVGHSIGGLIARIFAAEFPQDVAGMVLVDSTTEDTTLNYQGKIVRVRDGAKGRVIPPIQTFASSPPKPPTKDDLDQAEFNKQIFGAPMIKPPFDKLSQSTQSLRLWALNNPKLSAASDDFWPEELQAMHESRARAPFQLGNLPLIVLIGGRSENAPQGVADEVWNRISDEKRKQKEALADLSQNSKVIIAENSGHHIHLDQPDVVIKAIRQVFDSARSKAKFSQKNKK